jgi:Trypsin-like peptidase domain
MKNSIRTIAAILCLALGASTSQAQGPYGSINIGNWHGGAYTDDKSGAFSHCAAAASYLFLVSVNQDFGWTLGFAHQNWKLAPREAFPLALTFDGQAAINVQGMPIGTNLVSVAMPANSALITQFRKAKVMTAFAQAQLLQFKLTQTAELLPSLVNCVASVKKSGIASAGEFALPKSAAKPAAATAQGQPGSAASKPSKTVGKTGTGFVVSSSGHVVTNQHVVDGCVDDIKGNLSGEAPVKLRLVSSDETNDLALRQAPSPFKEVASGTSRCAPAIVLWRSAIRSTDC